MNAVEETTTEGDKIRSVRSDLTKKRALKFVQPIGLPSCTFDPVVFKFLSAAELVTTYDHIFDRYVKLCILEETSTVFHMDSGY